MDIFQGGEVLDGYAESSTDFMHSYDRSAKFFAKYM